MKDCGDVEKGDKGKMAADLQGDVFPICISLYQSWVCAIACNKAGKKGIYATAYNVVNVPDGVFLLNIRLGLWKAA